jgi:hypothetical protein
MAELPREAEKVLAVAPGDFVAARDRLARELREAGRADDAAAVAALKKPSAVVFAVNRAARDRPQAAKDAAKAAEKVEKAQGRGDADAFRTGLHELEGALDMLGEVAVAHVGSPPSDAMRRRVHDLLRRAAADPDTRKALTRGALVAEQEATGFAALAGVAPPKAGRGSRPTEADRRAKRRDEERAERAKALRAELEAAEKELADARREERAAVHARERAERAVEGLREKLDRLG